jgi:hypothetical protein
VAEHVSPSALTWRADRCGAEAEGNFRGAATPVARRDIADLAGEKDGELSPEQRAAADRAITALYVRVAGVPLAPRQPGARLR